MSKRFVKTVCQNKRFVKTKTNGLSTKTNETKRRSLKTSLLLLPLPVLLPEKLRKGKKTGTGTGFLKNFVNF